MKANVYLADTNAFLYLLEKKEFVLPFLEAQWHYSVITEVELLGFYKIKAEEITAIKALLSICSRHPITEDIIDRAISLKQSQKLKTTDALIAATALNLKVP